MAKAAGFVAGTASKILIWITEKFSELPFASLPASYRFVAIWIVGSLLLLGMVFGIRLLSHLPAALRTVVYRHPAGWNSLLSAHYAEHRPASLPSPGKQLRNCRPGGTELCCGCLRAQRLPGSELGKGAFFPGSSAMPALHLPGRPTPRTDNALAAFVRMLPTDRMALSSSGGQLQPVVQRLSDPEIFSLDELPVSFSVGDSLQVYLAEQSFSL